MPGAPAVRAPAPASDRPFPGSAGIGLKARFYQEVLDTSPPLDWFEVHPENYMVEGGPPLRYLEAIRSDYPLSLHGVGMSLGSVEPPAPDHLDHLARLIDRFEPFVVSEHLSWSRTEDAFLADLLPVPMTREALATVSANVGRAQDRLGRALLVENPSAYLRFRDQDIPEPEFLSELARRTGCGLLLDVNNLFVSACNQGFDPVGWLDAFHLEAVEEIHLAGHAVDQANGHEIRVDDHGSPVPTGVWDLYRTVIRRRGPTPTLIERDANLPPLADLVAEARTAARIMRETAAGTGADRSRPVEAGAGPAPAALIAAP